jgi:predicted glycosyl hydrolase (DUF1957 family)
MNPRPNPDERFAEMHSILEQLSNSQRHLLTAQVLMNDRMDRAERAIQKLAETMVALADSQKHTDEKLAALTDIIRHWYERHGNGQKLS